MKSATVIFISILLVGIAIPGIAQIENIESNQRIGHIGYNPLPVKDIAFYSSSLDREMHINIVLPESYEHSNISYPVLYLCHGFTANYHEFKHIGVPEYLNRFDMIVVMVDVGNSSYVNWAKSDSGKPLNFADHVCVDVINYVDEHYRTIPSRKGRAINGISMGANGAISMGLSHPDLFCSIAGHSGGYSMDNHREALRKEKAKEEVRNDWFEKMTRDTTMYYRGIDIEGFSTMRDRTPKGKIFTTEEQIDSVDPFKLIVELPREKLPHIYIDCGVDDFLYESTVKFMNFMRENKIPFAYSQDEGTHEEDYWGKAVSISMAVQYAILLRHIWGREFEIYDPYSMIED
jgi:S-formylglutathione hydrolase FrmB